MVDVTVNGYLNCTDGTVIPLQTDLTQGTEGNLTVNSTYAVASGVEVGDYAPGKTIRSGNVMAPNGISYCYILRQGLIASLIPVNIIGVSNTGSTTLCAPFTLQAGDVVRAMTTAAADRECSIYVYTNKGTSRIFTVTPSGAATNLATDLQTSNGLGNTLQGENIVKAFATSVDGALIDGGGVVAVNEVGQVIGVVQVTDPGNAQPEFSMVNIPVALNYAFQVVTTA